jgi:hypothetical protein
MANGTFPVWNTGLRVLLAAAFGITMTVVVVISAWYSESRLGAPLYWTWVLTGIQVLALWAAGRRHWWAWLLGAAVQLPWIAYALLTDQHGFVPGCLLSAAVQVWTLTRPADRDCSDGHP